MFLPRISVSATPAGRTVPQIPPPGGGCRRWSAAVAGRWRWAGCTVGCLRPENRLVWSRPPLSSPSAAPASTASSPSAPRGTAVPPKTTPLSGSLSSVGGGRTGTRNRKSAGWGTPAEGFDSGDPAPPKKTGGSSSQRGCGGRRRWPSPPPPLCSSADGTGGLLPGQVLQLRHQPAHSRLVQVGQQTALPPPQRLHHLRPFQHPEGFRFALGGGHAEVASRLGHAQAKGVVGLLDGLERLVQTLRLQPLRQGDQVDH